MTKTKTIIFFNFLLKVFCANLPIAANMYGKVANPYNLSISCTVVGSSEDTYLCHSVSTNMRATSLLMTVAVVSAVIIITHVERPTYNNCNILCRVETLLIHKIIDYFSNRLSNSIILITSELVFCLCQVLTPSSTT